jgi:hypothetical protein
MDRQTTLLLSLGTLIAAALAVGIGGWILLVRDRRLAKSDPSSGAGEASTPGDVSHPEVTEGS